MNHVPPVADPVLALLYFASLPAFSVVQIPWVAKIVTDGFIGADNADMIRRSHSSSADHDER